MIDVLKKMQEDEMDWVKVMGGNAGQSSTVGSTRRLARTNEVLLARQLVGRVEECGKCQKGKYRGGGPRRPDTGAKKEDGWVSEGPRHAGIRRRESAYTSFSAKLVRGTYEGRTRGDGPNQTGGGSQQSTRVMR